MPIVDELVTLLGAKQDPRAESVLARWHGQIAVVLNSATQLGKSVYGAFEKMGRSIMGAADSALGLEQMSARTKLSTDAIQAMGYAAEQAGGSAGEMYEDLEKLSMDAARQGMSSEAYIKQVAQGFTGMTAIQAEAWRSYYGVSRSFYYTSKDLAQGMDDLVFRARRRGAIISDKDLKNAAEADKDFHAVNFVFGQLAKTLWMDLVPVLTPLVQGFNDWITANQAMLQQEIPKLCGQIAEGVKALAGWITGTAIPAVGSFIKSLDDLLGKGNGVKACLIALGVMTFGGTIASMGMLMLKMGPLALMAADLAWLLHEIKGLNDELNGRGNDSWKLPKAQQTPSQLIGNAIGEVAGGWKFDWSTFVKDLKGGPEAIPEFRSTKGSPELIHNHAEKTFGDRAAEWRGEQQRTQDRDAIIIQLEYRNLPRGADITNVGTAGAAGLQ